MRRRLAFPHCVEMLDSALVDVEPRLTEMEIPILRALVLANNEMVMWEMERRGTDPLASSVHFKV
jgi:hypothetical protein